MTVYCRSPCLARTRERPGALRGILGTNVNTYDTGFFWRDKPSTALRIQYSAAKEPSTMDLQSKVKSHEPPITPHPPSPTSPLLGRACSTRALSQPSSLPLVYLSRTAETFLFSQRSISLFGSLVSIVWHHSSTKLGLGICYV